MRHLIYCTGMGAAAMAALLLPAAGLAGCAAEEDDVAVAAREVEVEDPRTPGPCSVVYRAETAIAAEPLRVWEILADWESYSEWNPFIVDAHGEAVPGAVVDITVVLGSERREMQYTVQTAEPGVELCTQDKAWFTFLVYGQRCRTLELTEDGTVLVKQELLTEGPFAHLSGVFYGARMQEGIEAENAALKQRAEEGP